MRKKLLKMLSMLTVSAISLLPFSPTVSAENEKAAEIREILNSKTFYIEYEVNKKEDKRALAVDGTIKKSFDCEGRRSATFLSYLPVVGLFAKGSLKLMPEVYYDSNSGYYYQFVTKKKILKANEEEMKDPYISPKEEWNTLPLRIKLPEDLGMFTGDESIKFVESNTKVIDEQKNKKVEFDKYFKVIKSVTGQNIAKRVYLVFYDEKGELDKICTLTVNWNEDAGTIFNENDGKKLDQQDYEIQTLNIRQLTRELPKDVMKFPNGSKVYGPGLGNMDELLDQVPLLEEFKSEE